MTKRKRILRGVLILGLLLLVALLWPKPCEMFGGMLPRQSWQCSCTGILWTVQNDAPTDGLTIRKCIGVATRHVCQQPDGKPHIHEVVTVPCSE